MIKAEKNECNTNMMCLVEHLTMFSIVTGPLPHSASREGGEVLEGGSLGGGGSNNNGVLHGVVFLEGLHELSDGQTLLTNGDINIV